MDITATMDQLKAERANPVYTAPIGTTVQWFDRGEGEPRAAIVTGIERPGVVSLTIFAVQSGPSFRKGVMWAHHPHVQDRLGKGDPNIVRNGTWDYAPENLSDKGRPPRSHEQYHARDIERREAGALKQKAEYDQAEAARQAREADKAKKLQPA